MDHCNDGQHRATKGMSEHQGQGSGNKQPGSHVGQASGGEQQMSVHGVSKTVLTNTERKI